MFSTKQQTSSSRPTRAAEAARTPDQARSAHGTDAWRFWRSQHSDRTRAHRPHPGSAWASRQQDRQRARQQQAQRARRFQARDTTRTVWAAGVYR